MEEGEMEEGGGREMEGGGRDGEGGGREMEGGGRDGEGRRERWRMLIEEQEPEERRPGN